MDTLNTGSGLPLSSHITRDYNIIRLLGKGGMGEVYLAEQLRVGRRRVALKVLSRACSEDPDIVKRFENEAASAGRIQHPNVVMIYESRVTEDGQIYVVMEYVDGNSLRGVIAERGALPVDETVEIAKQLCAGLATAHKLGIVHRDVKPDNIMLAHEEEGALIVKVLDFGIARLLEPGTGEAQTKSGVIMGTPFYMSPEQALGNTGDKIDSRSDIYSLGMVVYQMLTGRVAFESDSWMRVMYKHINESPVTPSQLRPELGSFKEVEQVVLKALEKDRENRQQSVTAFGTELEAAYKQAQASLSEGSSAGSYDATVLTGDSSLAPATAQVVTTPTGQPQPVAESTQPDLLPPTTGAATRVIWSRRNAMAAIAVALIVVAGLVGFATIPRKEPVNAATSSATPSLRPSPMPVIQSYDFPVMTVSPTGQIEGIKQGEARFYNEDLGNGLIIEMMEIPGGSFHMGAPSETQNTPHSNERPQHKVTLPGFYMGYTEVTQAQWLLVSKLPKVSQELDPNPSAFKGDATMPVQNVCWWEAVEFCERLSIATGRTYRLPTEAEWEYACRAGTATAFCFGQTITDKIVNYDGNYPYGAGRKGITRKQPVTAGNLTAENAFGLNNTHGNMAEWCLDSWHDNYAGAPADGSSWDDGGNQSLRVFRGGSWYDGGDNCRSAFRNSYAPDIKLSIIGFRVVMIPIK